MPCGPRLNAMISSSKGLLIGSCGYKGDCYWGDNSTLVCLARLLGGGVVVL